MHDQPATPVDPLDDGDDPGRHLRLAFIGETAVKILINGQKLTDPNLAERLRVDIVLDSPTFAGNNSNKTVKISPTHTQASIVKECPLSGTCEGNVFYDYLWGSVTSGPHRGTIADGDYTVKLYRDGSTLVSSKAIAVNHPNTGGSNGSFLDEANDQTVTFYLNSSLNQIQAPTVDKPHTRASTHLSASIIQPAGSDTTITVGQSLTVKGSASNGVGGTKKYAWDWNATGGNQETFDTEFSTSTTASHTYTATGDYKIRLIVRDGNDNPDVAPRGGHYAVSTTKTVHVVGTDNATAQGNTFPASMQCGGTVSVNLTMKNTGTTTWTTAYKLKLTRQLGYWTPTSVNLTSSVAPNQTKTFTFNLHHASPDGSGTTVDAFYRMANASGVLFGQENGGGIYLIPGSCPLLPQGALSPSPSVAVAPERVWLREMVNEGVVELPLDQEG